MWILSHIAKSWKNLACTLAFFFVLNSESRYASLLILSACWGEACTERALQATCARARRHGGRWDCECDTGVWFEYLPAPTEQWSIISLSSATPCWQLLHACNLHPSLSVSHSPPLSPLFVLIFLSISLVSFQPPILRSISGLMCRVLLIYSVLPCPHPPTHFSFFFFFSHVALSAFSHIISPGSLVLSISLAVALPEDIAKKEIRGEGWGTDGNERETRGTAAGAHRIQTPLAKCTSIL